MTNYVLKLVVFSCLFFIATGSVSTSAKEVIPRFSQVSQGLYRGGRPTVDGLKYLRFLGVKTIVNLQGGDPQSFLYGAVASWLEPGEDPANIEKERVLAEGMKMNFWHAPLNSFDAVSKYDAVLIDQTLQVMREKQPVYVHCEHGKDRTGLLVALYRVKYEGWDIESAYTEWTQKGHGWLLLLSDELDEYFFRKAGQLKSQNLSHP